MRRIWLLGGLRIAREQSIIRLAGSKTRNLFAYLALHPAMPHPRDVLADVLWPDVAPERVRRQLPDTLYRLRQSPGADWLIAEGGRVALHRDDVWVDVAEFRRLCAAHDLDSLQAALELTRTIAQGNIANRAGGAYVLGELTAIDTSWQNNQCSTQRGGELSPAG
jgi:DNA-binding SARP family transcriptional activator